MDCDGASVVFEGLVLVNGDVLFLPTFPLVSLLGLVLVEGAIDVDGDTLGATLFLPPFPFVPLIRLALVEGSIDMDGAGLGTKLFSPSLNEEGSSESDGVAVWIRSSSAIT